MGAPVKTVAGAYGMAIVGVVLGVVGMHRFYARHYLTGALMTAIFLCGIVLLTYEFIVKYYALLDSLTQSLGAIQGGGGYASIPDITQHTRPGATNISTAIGTALCATGITWWVIDLFLIPKIVAKYRKEYNA